MFFHKVMREINRRNFISDIDTSKGGIEDMEGVKHNVMKNFEERFK